MAGILDTQWPGEQHARPATSEYHHHQAKVSCDEHAGKFSDILPDEKSAVL